MPQLRPQAPGGVGSSQDATEKRRGRVRDRGVSFLPERAPTGEGDDQGADVVDRPEQDLPPALALAQRASRQHLRLLDKHFSCSSLVSGGVPNRQ